jgi:hypothetical protein
MALAGTRDHARGKDSPQLSLFEEASDDQS